MKYWIEILIHILITKVIPKVKMTSVNKVLSGFMVKMVRIRYRGIMWHLNLFIFSQSWSFFSMTCFLCFPSFGLLLLLYKSQTFSKVLMEKRIKNSVIILIITTKFTKSILSLKKCCAHEILVKCFMNDVEKWSNILQNLAVFTPQDF